MFYTEVAQSIDSERSNRLLTSLREMNVPCYVVSDPVMAVCSDTEPKPESCSLDTAFSEPHLQDSCFR